MGNGKPTTRQLRKEKFQAPQKAWKRLRATLKAFEDEKYMKYNRVLGFGGFGLVQDWDILKKDGSRDRSIAIKTVVNKGSRSSIESIKREIWWTKKFTGSEHLIQLADLDKRVMKAANFNDEITSGMPNIAMEKLGRGSLYLLIHRIKYAADWNAIAPEHLRLMEYIPNRTLWQIFQCLTRAVIGIAYPSTLPETRKGLSIRETTQGIPDKFKPERIVHNDIDVGNIFVADPRDCPPDDEHPWAPIIKIADYGCMVQWDDTWTRAQKVASLWGKDSYKAPEQFPPRALGTLSMGDWTNVYQIGQVMQDLITLKFVNYSIRNFQWRTTENNKIGFYTYGWRLLGDKSYRLDDDWRNVDIELRELVASCMADMTYDRPGLRELEGIISRRIADLAELVPDPRTELNPEAKESVPGQAPKTGLNPESKEFVPGQVPKTGLNPESKEFVPGEGPPADILYKSRVPMGKGEPEWLLKKFYRDYFVEAWEDPDKYEDYWSKKTLTPYVISDDEDEG
ncbi:kinase-like protein [Xylaria acuta]|nr:kinase-like protein [Xylaria acuta]